MDLDDFLERCSTSNGELLLEALLQQHFSLLHLPTRRLSFEEIVWHLINEHTPGVSGAEKDEWFEFLNESKTGYEERVVGEQKPGRPPLLEG